MAYPNDISYGNRRKRIPNKGMEVTGGRRQRENTYGIDWDKQYSNEYEEDEEDLSYEQPTLGGTRTFPVGNLPNRKKAEQHINAESQDDTDDLEKATVIQIDGKDITLEPLSMSKQTKEETRKLTIYLPVTLIEQLQNIKNLKYIPSYSWLMEQAVKEYLISRKQS